MKFNKTLSIIVLGVALATPFVVYGHGINVSKSIYNVYREINQAVTVTDLADPNHETGIKTTVTYSPTTTSTGSVFAHYGICQYVSSIDLAEPGHLVCGLFHAINNAAAKINDLVIGVEGKIVNTAGTITDAVAVLGVLTSNATSQTITNWAGFQSQISSNAGTITTAYLYRASVASAGTLTTLYGYHFPDLSALTIGTKYSWYNADSTGNMYSAAPFGIRDTTPTEAALVVDSANASLSPLVTRVNGTQTFAVRTDGGIQAYGGIIPIIVNTTLSIDHTNATITNTADGDGVQYTLPNDPGVPSEFCFALTVAQTVTIIPSSGETLYKGIDQCVASLTANAIGANICIKATKTGSGATWMVRNPTAVAADGFTCND